MNGPTLREGVKASQNAVETGPQDRGVCLLLFIEIYTKSIAEVGTNLFVFVFLILSKNHVEDTAFDLEVPRSTQLHVLHQVYLGLFRQLDKKFFILFNGKDKVRDWLGFTKNFGLRVKRYKTFQVQWLLRFLCSISQEGTHFGTCCISFF